jgi:hypothetical protein
MINIFLVSDEEDEKLGCFLKTCSIEIKKLFTSNVNIIELTSKMIQNEIVINQRISEIDTSFVFIAFTHGSDSELTGSKNIPYVAVGKNDNLFKDTLFYCFSCKTGVILGKEIINKKGKCFVGHTKEVYASNISKYQHLFYQPILFFWMNFISGNTIFSCVQAKKEEYTRIIDNIYEEDMFHASYLMNNRDSLVVYGVEDCCINDFSF